MDARSLVAVLALVALPAWADIFKCVDEEGHVTYSNIQSKGCRKLNLDPVTTVPPPKATKSPTPPTFPKVDNDTQKARDEDRRRILETEMAAEQRNLELARKELSEQEAAGDDHGAVRGGDRLQPLRERVTGHERNIEAIRKELGNLR